MRALFRVRFRLNSENILPGCCFPYVFDKHANFKQFVVAHTVLQKNNKFQDLCTFLTKQAKLGKFKVTRSVLNSVQFLKTRLQFQAKRNLRRVFCLQFQATAQLGTFFFAQVFCKRHFALFLDLRSKFRQSFCSACCFHNL